MQNFSPNWQCFGPNFPKKVFPVKKWKSDHHYWTPDIQVSLCTKFLLNLKILIFLTRFAILHIQISLVRNFSSNWQFWFFGPNFPKKIFPVKNWKSELHRWIFHIQISLCETSAQNDNFLFGPNLPKKVFPVKNWKTEHHQWILHIFKLVLHITKFLHNLIVLIFLTRFALKGFFGLNRKS